MPKTPLPYRGLTTKNTDKIYTMFFINSIFSGQIARRSNVNFRALNRHRDSNVLGAAWEREQARGKKFLLPET